MFAKYTTAKKDKLELYLYSDLLEPKTFRDKVIIRKVNNKVKSIYKKVFTNSIGNYFYWDHQKIYFKDFDYKPAEELISYINDILNDNKLYINNKPYDLIDDLLCTLMKENDKINVIIKMPCIDFSIPFMGINITSDKYKEVVCKLTEKRYKKNNWEYKITLTPINENELHKVTSEDFYFSDFYSCILRGDAKLILV